MELRKTYKVRNCNIQQSYSDGKPSTARNLSGKCNEKLKSNISTICDGNINYHEATETCHMILATQNKHERLSDTCQCQQHHHDDNEIWSSCRFVRKSKTHDGVMAMGCYNNTDGSQDGGMITPLRSKGRIVSSISFSGAEDTNNAIHVKTLAEDNSPAGCSKQIIDYRNFVPQMPFVPAVAKSLPRKRISLRKSKIGFKDLFSVKRNKQESTLSFDGISSVASSKYKKDKKARTGKYVLKTGESFAGDCLAQDFSDSDPPSDSSYDYFSTFCEDVASLKSFDSNTGCGEIFAEEDSHTHLEIEKSKLVVKEKEEQKQSPVLGVFQGGVEQLASPAQTEVGDFLGIWDNISKSAILHHNVMAESKVLETPMAESNQQVENPLFSAPDSQGSPEKVLERTKDASVDMGTPKSDHQGSTSTSDEGYYDSCTPGLEEEPKESLTPCLSSKFPRDSYSGDALYELFYDPNEAHINPALDDDVSVSESVLGQSVELPLSMYSFNVGDEEKMASQTSLDIINQEFLQSKWKGKECLLKLCDTELSLAMGIVNWLRHKATEISPNREMDSMTSVPLKENYAFNTEQHGEKLQEDLDRLAKWQMQSNVDKCKEMHLGTGDK
ncbi:APC membrane recruitment protein 3 [Latimeria chalumnae]|uniref:APC membrane recruitment protein 3 n=1 Tax=Latimeria chalumnae TaxID=7897 RepID=UPI0006D91035|nr:PREDICTED: APC membrane recruitment protein 3 [Latimeria chalumnae]|eukprot:XP_005991275.2 PREDICTED: APC membrane recruitment protein 3 [Latimeria chalumnae]